MRVLSNKEYVRGMVVMGPLFRKLWIDLRCMKHYLIAASFVFFVGVWMGATDERLINFIHNSLQGMGDIAGKIRQSEHPQLWFFVFIFFNNVIKSIFFVFFGAILAIVPLFVLVVNGMTLGYVVVHPSQDLSPWVIIMKGILPHGIIELPAIILACAYGIRFGSLLFRGIFSLINQDKRTKAGLELMHFLSMTVPLMIVLIVSLFIAAIIESTFTYWLMGG
jgi:stage II sporulation protein M